MPAARFLVRTNPEMVWQQLISLKHTSLIKQMSIIKERKKKRRSSCYSRVRRSSLIFRDPWVSRLFLLLCSAFTNNEAARYGLAQQREACTSALMCVCVCVWIIPNPPGDAGCGRSSGFGEPFAL